jgi:hypothetical protein
MIELDGTKVLRYTEEEIYRLKEQYRDNVPEGVSWLREHIKKMYPEMVVLASHQDDITSHVYVILAHSYPITYRELIFMEDGTMQEIEYLV